MATDGGMAEERRRCLDAILRSESHHRLIVAGPGTGKTYTFTRVIEELEGAPLVITFLNLLVRDLGDELGDGAWVYSFHGYSRWALHSQGGEGVTTNVDYYPPLVLLQVEDILVRWNQVIEPIALGGMFRGLIEDEVRDLALESGSYYDAVGYDDSVYRVLRRLQARPESTPSYPLVLVDEYQDFSSLEVGFIRELARVSPTLVVGDDDQALYAFRDASPDAIRELHADEQYANYCLPYCSRCTEIIVSATQTIVARAQDQGLLTDRIDKPYICYLPDKEADSDRYPHIVHATCSVQRPNAIYMGRYIASKIEQISDEDVHASREGSYPTVLVIGPKPFLPQVGAFLQGTFSDVRLPAPPTLEVRAEDGYHFLARDGNSRLGWRILVHLRKPEGWEEAIVAALERHTELMDLLPEQFLAHEQYRAGLFQRAHDGEELDEGEWEELALALEESQDQLRERLTETVAVRDEEATEGGPSIMLTSLMGSKGLQAEHVFVVGVNSGHFPRDNDQPTNVEVCQLLVALTRARKSCTLVSTRWLGGTKLDRSVFVKWLAPHLTDVYVDKEYLENAGA